jgi:cytochrome c5
MRYNAKKIIFLCGLTIMIAALASWQSPRNEDDRNLKVLPKDISSDSLERVMDDFTVALNVDCRFCHAPKDPKEPKKLNYASDANQLKEITRTMLRMTNEINGRYMKTLPGNEVQLVTCNTCHRGQPVPEK